MSDDVSSESSKESAISRVNFWKEIMQTDKNEKPFLNLSIQ